MIESIRWLLGLEILGLVFLPVTAVVLGRTRDAGYAFSKVMGLLLVTYATWLIGSFIPVARSPLLPALAVVAGLVGWWLWRDEAVSRLRQAWGVIAVEEAIFVLAFVIWALLRVNVFGTAAEHTEQFMDMALLNASYHSASFPAFDPWMSGHSINYYYFGYLLWATFTKLVGVVPAVGFNLANVSIFALVVSCAFSIGFNLTGSRFWALLAPAFLAVVGNMHAAFWGLAHGTACGTSVFWNTFWESTRIIGSDFTLSNWSSGPPWAHAVPCGDPTNTITEYPLFSFILGDLHPHVMALPLVLLVIGLAVAYLFGSGERLITRDAAGMARLILLAVAAGSLFVTNSWDFPTYLLLLVGAILMRAYVEDPVASWWRGSGGAAAALAFLSLLLYLPFYLHFTSLSAGIGFVTDPSDLFEFLQVFGLFLAASVLLVGSLYALLQPEPEVAERFDVVSEAGEARTSNADRLLMLGAAGAVLIAAGAAHRLTLICLLGLGLGALAAAYRVLNTEQPNRADATALLLVAVGCFAAALPEVVYLRDIFSGGSGYRLNTVFKFYYQAWVLLGLASAYGAYRSWSVLQTIASRTWAWGAMALIAVLTLGAGIYTFWVPSANVNAATPATLNAAAWLRTSDPGECRAIDWLSQHANPQQVILEAVGSDYQTNGTLISTFAGLPTVMGWQGHEGQWRPDDPDIQRRASDVKTIYTTLDVRLARQLLRRYSVRYVVVGEAEKAQYAAKTDALGKFSHFMRTAYTTNGATVYTW